MEGAMTRKREQPKGLRTRLAGMSWDELRTRAGHGAGSPTTKQIDEWADRFAFLANALKMHAGS